jgi:tRNA A37 threonylcarbamoyladenosine dehydratase
MNEKLLNISIVTLEKIKEILSEYCICSEDIKVIKNNENNFQLSGHDFLIKKVDAHEIKDKLIGLEHSDVVVVLEDGMAHRHQSNQKLKF